VSAPSPTVGVVNQGQLSTAQAQSGRPYHLAHALEEEGCRVLRIRAAPPPGVDRAVLGALRRLRGTQRAYEGPEIAWIRTRVLRHRVRALPRDVPFVLVGTSFSPPAGRRFVTYDDMTIAQAVVHYPEWRRLPRWALDRRRRLQAELYRNAVACCVTSAWTAASVIADYGVSPAKVHVVGLGGRLMEAPAERRWEVPRYLFVGRDWERKNGAAVVRAFAEVRKRHPEATLDLVGEHPPQAGPGIRDHGYVALSDPGDRARVGRLFAQATCFVVPSRHEPTGIAFAEAAAAGLPSIGSIHGGSGEVIGPSGVVVDPERDDELVAAMLALADPERARELSARARERAALYRWGAVARRILRALGIGPPGGPITEEDLPLHGADVAPRTQPPWVATA
jgi:glycosyltransferase involved in cell wall biosynthesis